MSDALPVLVECPPYKAKLQVERCVDRYVLANKWKKGDGAGAEAQDTALMRGSFCKNCELGKERKEVAGNAPPTASSGPGRVKTQRRVKRAAAAKLKERLIVVDPAATSAGIAKDEEEKTEMKITCPDCGEEKQRLDKLPNGVRACRGCAIKRKKNPAPAAAARKGTNGARVTGIEHSPLTGYLSLLAAHKALEQRQAAELADSKSAMASHLREHPEVKQEATALLEELAS